MKSLDWLDVERDALDRDRTWQCQTCGCDLVYPLEVQVNCHYPDCTGCRQSVTADRAVAGDR